MKKLLFIFIICFTLNGFGQNEFLEDTTQLLFTLRIEPVKAVDSDKVLKNVKLKIFGTDNSDREYMSDSLGIFPIIVLNQNTSYSIIVEAKGHLLAKGKETTVGKEKSLKFLHEYVLQPYIDTYCPILPEITYIENGIQPLNTEGIYVPFFNLMNENPSLVVRIIAYRNKSEKKNISKKRAKAFAKNIIGLGLDKQRLKVADGGFFEDTKRKDTYLTLKVISTDYSTKKN